MGWDDTKIAKDDFTSADWNAMVIEFKTRAKVSSGAGAPSSTPTMLGAIYIDTTATKMYIALGTSSSADWKKVISQ